MRQIEIFLGMGCFWGYERLFNELYPHIFSEVGYASSNELLSPIEVTRLLIRRDHVKDITKTFLSYHYVEVDDDFPVPARYQSAVLCNDDDSRDEISRVIADWEIDKKIKIRSKVVSSFVYQKAEPKHQKRYLSDRLICSPMKYDF